MRGLKILTLVQTARPEMDLSKLQNAFVLISKCILLDCKIYLSGLQNVFACRGVGGLSEGVKDAYTSVDSQA